MTALPLAPVRLMPGALIPGVALGAPVVRLARRLAAERGWPSVYRAVADELARQHAAGHLDPDTPRWYALAAEINDAASRHFAHFFTRSYLALEVKRQTGLTLDPAGETMQRCSDLIAESVLGPLVSGRSERVGRFAHVGPLETQRLTRRLVPGLVLDRTAWPAYAQLAWTNADRRFHGLVGRFLPFWRRGLPRWACPADTFADTSFLDVLSPIERDHVRASAKAACRHAKACAKAGRWVAA